MIAWEMGGHLDTLHIGEHFLLKTSVLEVGKTVLAQQKLGWRLWRRAMIESLCLIDDQTY
jgi:hypothetical protein